MIGGSPAVNNRNGLRGATERTAALWPWPVLTERTACRPLETASAGFPPKRDPGRVVSAVTRRIQDSTLRSRESLGDYDDLFGLLSPVALRDLELDPLTLFEGAVPVRLDR